MTTGKTPQPNDTDDAPSDQGSARDDDRRAKLSRALRANLKRRKPKPESTRD